MVRYEIQRDKAVIFIDSAAHGTQEVFLNVEHLAKVLRVSNLWYVSKHEKGFYAYTSVKSSCGKATSLFMHRVVMDCPDTMEIDHINRNGLDNRKRNLRIVTHAQNMQNRGTRADSMSGKRNVRYDKFTEMWVVKIFKDGKTVCSERFLTEKEAVAEAARARKEIFPFSVEA